MDIYACDELAIVKDVKLIGDLSYALGDGYLVPQACQYSVFVYIEDSVIHFFLFLSVKKADQSL